MRASRIVASSLLLVCLSVEVRAQELPPAVIHQVGAASQVRVRLVEGGWGTLSGPSMDSVSLSYTGSRFRGPSGRVQLAAPLPMTQVAQIQVPHGSHSGSGARIGGAIGLGITLLAIVATSGSDWASPTTGQAVVAGMVWTAIGSAVGALIGSGSRRWTTVYTADAP